MQKIPISVGSGMRGGRGGGMRSIDAAAAGPGVDRASAALPFAV